MGHSSRTIYVRNVPGDIRESEVKDLFYKGGGGNLPCMQKLLPCQLYLKASSTPPAACCVPLKEIVADDSKCLCAVFNNPDILKGLNTTQEDALNMTKHCGANADTSLCKKGSTTNSTAHSSATSSASMIPYFRGTLPLAAAILNLIAPIIF